MRKIKLRPVVGTALVKMGLLPRRWNILAKLINNYGIKTYCEVGIMEGNTAFYVLKNCNLNQLYLIDPYLAEFFTEYENQHNCIYKSVLNKFAPYKQVQVIRAMSPQAASRFENGSLGLVFIDADHSYGAVVADILAWLPKVKPGGFLAGHDYQKSYPGVIKAVDEVLQRTHVNVLTDSVWVYRKAKKPGCDSSE